MTAIYNEIDRNARPKDTMTAFYSEIDPFAARWLRNLIAEGHIAPGVVDERSISDLAPADVTGPGQRHFFAGIAGWSHALRLARVPDDADIWTGSCPCQPFSDAGRGAGFDDDRHLWPVWFRLIRECRPPIVLGEQVASRSGLAWLDAVCTDLEGAGYAVGAADLCAASVGAPHRRQRLFFVAYANEAGRGIIGSARLRVHSDASHRDNADRCSTYGRMANTGESRLEVVGEQQALRELASTERGRPVDWRHCDWIPCSDGVSRPAEPGTHPLAHGIPARVGKLRAYGNAIVPEVAATFIRAALEA